MDTNRLTRRIFDCSYTASSNGCINWSNDVFNILVDLDIQSAFNNKCAVNNDDCKAILANKRTDKWLNAVQNKPKLRFYALFKECFDAEKYVEINLTSSCPPLPPAF